MMIEEMSNREQTVLLEALLLVISKTEASIIASASMRDDEFHAARVTGLREKLDLANLLYAQISERW